MTPLTLAGAIFGGLAVAAGAATAGLVVTTSGPFANSAAPTASATAATPVTTGAPPATVTATASATSAATTTPGGTTATPTATVPVDSQGWPIVTCPPGLTSQKSTTRKITGCGPADFAFSSQENDPQTGGSQNALELILAWQNLQAKWEYMSVEVITRASTRFPKESWQGPCDRRTASTVAGYAAEECLILREDVNGSALDQSDTWGLQEFVQTPDYWIAANAAGPQSGPDRDSAIATARAAFRDLAVNGLGRVK